MVGVLLRQTNQRLRLLLRIYSAVRFLLLKVSVQPFSYVWKHVGQLVYPHLLSAVLHL